LTKKLRESLLSLLGRSKSLYDCVPIQGSGTFAVESMLGTFVPRDGKLLVLANGAYGLRAAQTMDYLNRDYHLLDKGDYLPPRGSEVANILEKDKAITHVLVIHCETSSGILNPLEEIGAVVKSAGRKLLIDSMSAFGAVPVDPEKVDFEAMVSSANKCIEGVPGFGFVFAKLSALQTSKGNCHSLSLDVEAQWSAMEKSGQWRFTPPTHVVAAFLKALELHKAEGGVSGRGARYTNNRDVMVKGMRDLGFETLLDERWLSPIIVTFFCPEDPAFEFSKFYDLMKNEGYIIYPGKLTIVDSFRVGCIGRMDSHVMQGVVSAAQKALETMGVKSAAPPKAALLERKRLSELQE
jgi:2-aminoethylphosphonate-pyruvate transaminase